MFAKLLDNIGSSSKYIKILKKICKNQEVWDLRAEFIYGCVGDPDVAIKGEKFSVNLSWNCKSLGILFLVPRTRQTGTPLLSHKENRTLYNTLLVLQIDTCLELLRITCDGWV